MVLMYGVAIRCGDVWVPLHAAAIYVVCTFVLFIVVFDMHMLVIVALSWRACVQ